jgi:hypothetical protein
MNYTVKNIISYCFLCSVLFISCKNDVEYTEKSGGYLEYQYDYKIEIDGIKITKQAFKRVNLTGAGFAFYKTNDLPDSIVIKNLPDSIVDGIPDSIQKYSDFRRVELFLYSGEYNPDDSIHNQSLGTTLIQLSLIDSLANDANPNRVLSYNYNTNSNLSSVYYTKKPICNKVSINMNMSLDTLSNTNLFEYTFSGQNGRKVNIYNLGNGKFQITSNGIYNNKIYTFHYVGDLKNHDVINNSILP